MRVRWLVIVALLLAAPAWAQSSEEVRILAEMEAAGLFERARGGDDRAASLFVREFVWRVNPGPGCDPRGLGWLMKTAGGKNIDGYAEDAVVRGSDPNNLRNVHDIVGGAGAPGASVSYAWGDPVQRRTSDVWECARELAWADRVYIGVTSGGGQTGGGGSTDYSARLAAIEQQLASLGALLSGPINDQIGQAVLEAAGAHAAAQAARQAAEDAKASAAAALEVRDWLSRGLLVEIRAGILGTLRGTVTPRPE